MRYTQLHFIKSKHEMSCIIICRLILDEKCDILCRIFIIIIYVVMKISVSIFRLITLLTCIVAKIYLENFSEVFKHLIFTRLQIFFFFFFFK